MEQMLSARLQRLAIPGVLILVLFLSFSSQYLFLTIEPAPLSRKQSIIFNALIVGLLICYGRSCTVDAGSPPKIDSQSVPNWALDGVGKSETLDSRPRWCKKCNAPKPPRAHHCRICGRYAAKLQCTYLDDEPLTLRVDAF